MKKMNKPAWLMISGLCWTITVAGQPGKPVNNHTIMAGVGYQVLTDDILKLSSQRLNTTAISYQVENSDIRHIKSIAIAYEKGVGNFSAGKLRSDAFILRYNNAFSVLHGKDRRWNNYTGYSVVLNPQYNKMNGQNAWISSNGVSLFNSFRYSWKHSGFEVNLSIPLLGLGSRTDSVSYYGTKTGMVYDSYSQLSFTSLHNLQAVNISFFYKTAIAEKLSMKAGIIWDYKRATWGSYFSQNTMSAAAGLSYNIW